MTSPDEPGCGLSRSIRSHRTSGLVLALVLPLGWMVTPRVRTHELVFPMSPGHLAAADGVREGPGRREPSGTLQAPAALPSAETPALADSPPGGTRPAASPAAAALPHSRSLARAIEAGTRTSTGEPGPRYWQQRVDYRIDATVDFSVPELRGRETITYHNNSPNAIDTLGLRLQQNVMKAEAPRTYAMPVTDGLKITRFAVGDTEISLADTARVRPEGGAFVGVNASQLRDLGTLVWIILPDPIPSGGKREITVEWSFRIPPESAPRMGMQDSTTVQMAQWYPQIAVYDDLNGWDHQLYLGTGEFYYEYGDFDVAVRVPPGFVVAATGTLQNPAEVLTPEGQKRLEGAGHAEEPVRILAAHEFGAGRILAAESSAPTVAWRFRAEDVRDFAFAASDHYLWDATHAVVDPAAGRTAMVHAVWRPERPLADQAVRMAAHAIAFHSAHITPYIYPQITVSEGGNGGMEYPMIVFVEAYGPTAGSPDPAPDEYSLIAHEIGHEWFPMMVGSNETAYGWQDEGLNTFRTVFATEDHDGSRSTNRQDLRESYPPVAGSDFEQSLMTHADAFPLTGPWYDVAAYDKPAMVLYVLRDVLGADLFDRTLSEYTRRWTLKHPAPQDFFNAFELAAANPHGGREHPPEDLDWFWRPWFYETDVLDLAVDDVEQRPDGDYAITVVNQGAAPAPIVADVQLADGSTRRLLGSAESLARQGAVTLRLPPGQAPVAVRLDPELAYPDADRSNDNWSEPAAPPPRSGREEDR